MRTPITLKIKFRSANLDQFIERYSLDVSRGGIFIRTKEPLAVGTLLRFEFQLQDASSLIAGEGTVVWVREHDPNRTGIAPGMGVRFDKLQPTSLQVLEKILAEKSKRGEIQMESRFDAGVRTSSPASKMASAPPRPNATDVESRRGEIPGSRFNAGVRTSSPASKMANTPPRPNAVDADRPGPPATASAPPRGVGHDFADELTRVAPMLASDLAQTAGDEFADESTRVMQNEFVQRLADQTRDQARDRDNAAASGPSTKVSVDHEAQSFMPASPPQNVVRPPAPTFNRETRVPATDSAKQAASVAPEQFPEVLTDLSKKSDRLASQKKASSAGLLVGAAVICLVAGGYLYLNQSGSKPRQEGAAPVPPLPEPTPLAAPSRAEIPSASPEAPGIQILSDPPGAEVSIDGTALPSPTPTVFKGFDEKKVYEVHLSKKGFHDWNTSLHPKPGEHVSVVLVPNEKEVEVTSTPGGADIILDGKRIGRTPFTIKRLDLSKMHQLEVKRPGFIAETHYITSADDFKSKGGKDVLRVAFTLKPEGKSAPMTTKAQKQPSEPANGDTTSQNSDTEPPSSKPEPAEPAPPEKKATEGKPQTEKPE